MNTYWVYILSNKVHTVLYVGVTNNLERRAYEHKNKLIPGFTAKYNLNELVFYEAFANIDDAIAVEKKIKGWTRKKKRLLIESMNKGWSDLATEILRFAQNDKHE